MLSKVKKREKALRDIFPYMSKPVLKELARCNYLSMRTLLFILLKNNKKNKRIKELKKNLGALNDIEDVVIVNDITISSNAFKVLIDAEKIARQDGRKKVIRRDIVDALKYYLDSIENNFLITEFFPATDVELEIAIHEVGHTMAAIFYPGDPEIRWIIAGVGIVPEPESDYIGVNCIYDFVTQETQTIKNLFKHCVVSVAGYEATCFVYPEYEDDPQGCECDFDDMRNTMDELITKCCQNGLILQFDGKNRNKDAKKIPEMSSEEHENHNGEKITKYKMAEESKMAEGNETNENSFQVKLNSSYVYPDAYSLPKEIHEQFEEEIFKRARHEARLIIQKHYSEFVDIVDTLMKKKIILRKELKEIHNKHKNDIL